MQKVCLNKARACLRKRRDSRQVTILCWQIIDLGSLPNCQRAEQKSPGGSDRNRLPPGIRHSIAWPIRVNHAEQNFCSASFRHGLTSDEHELNIRRPFRNGIQEVFPAAARLCAAGQSASMHGMLPLPRIAKAFQMLPICVENISQRNRRQARRFEAHLAATSMSHSRFDGVSRSLSPRRTRTGVSRPSRNNRQHRLRRPAVCSRWPTGIRRPKRSFLHPRQRSDRPPVRSIVWYSYDERPLAASLADQPRPAHAGCSAGPPGVSVAINSPLSV